jgi:hypothetical protein
MADNKTKATSKSVADFINAIKNDTRRKDSLRLLKLIKKKTTLTPKMWGPSIIGFGSYHYKYDSGREGDSPLVAFSPRADAIALYLSGGFAHREELLQKFGEHKASKGCIYVKNLDDVNLDILEKMIANHIKHIQSQYPNR